MAVRSRKSHRLLCRRPAPPTPASASAVRNGQGWALLGGLRPGRQGCHHQLSRASPQSGLGPAQDAGPWGVLAAATLHDPRPPCPNRAFLETVPASPRNWTAGQAGLQGARRGEEQADGTQQGLQGPPPAASGWALRWETSEL